MNTTLERIKRNSLEKIAGMRDVLIHDYLGVDLHLVWEIAKNEFLL